MSDFAKNLKKYRKQQGMSQRELSQRLHCGYILIVAWESGRMEPSAEEIAEIGGILHFSVEKLQEKEVQNQMETKETILDMTGCESIADMHERIRVTFQFPQYYGANLDALWDMGCEYIAAGAVRIQGVHTMPEEVQAYFLKNIMAILRDIAQYNGNLSLTVEN